MSKDRTQQSRTNDSTGDAAGIPRFYQVFREHAHQYGIGRTWRIFYAEFNSGTLLLSEDTLFGYLGSYLTGRDRYDPAEAAREPWGLVSATAADLSDSELFSLDGGDTWSVCHVQADGTRLHTVPSSNPVSPLSPVAVLNNNERCLVVRPRRPAPSTAPTREEQGNPPVFDLAHPCLAVQPGEVLVTYDYQQFFPALVESGYVALPRFRADVAIQIARYVAGENARSANPDVDDWLVIAPDRRSIVHLAPDIDDQGSWQLVLIAVDSLFDRDGQPQRCLIGAGRWPWTYDLSHDSP